MKVTSVPFANGAEGSAWMSAWCDHCAHDHNASHDGATASDVGCHLIASVLLDGEPPLDNEAWVAEPDDGTFALPSRMVCTLFQPCLLDDCCGDPLAERRALRVGEVMAYWRDKAARR